MCPTNVHPEYIEAEKRFYSAQTDQEKLDALKEMTKTVPKHKGAETLRAQIRTRYKKFKEKLQKNKQKSKARGKQQQGIKKLDMQATLFGFTNSGKSSVLKTLTNANPKIANYSFTTQTPEQAILNHGGCQIQIIDLPPILSKNFDTSSLNSTDTVLLVVEELDQIPNLKKFLAKSQAKQIVVFNKADLHNQNQLRKINANLKSKKYDFAMISTKTEFGIKELKEKIFQSFDKIRIYTKEPNKKEPEPEAMILEPESTINDAAKKALHGKAKDVARARIWGPSSKFAGQQVGLKHKLKDKDIVEFVTK